MNDAELADHPSLRELRRCLKTYVERNRPAIVGKWCGSRALIVPVPYHNGWDDDARSKAIRETVRRMKRALDLAFPRRQKPQTL